MPSFGSTLLHLALAPLVLCAAGCAEHHSAAPKPAPAQSASSASSEESPPAKAPVKAPAAPAPATAAEKTSPSVDAPPAHVSAPSITAHEMIPGQGRLMATFQTSMGTIEVELLEDDAPLTVANFVGLATGKHWFRDRDGKPARRPFYDGTIFHRVIPRFMIQGGDPLGTGVGGPGYTFRDEKQSLVFDRPGLLAMANSGPNTNGSQFFLTEVPTPHLNGHYTIFGRVIDGEDVIKAIARVPVGPGNRPLQPVTLEHVLIHRENPSH